MYFYNPLPTHHDMPEQKWGTNTGFVLAAVGSAVGMGNIWRFPYITGENGGGAFLIPYFTVTILFGLIFMSLEFAVGRYYNKSIIGSLASLGSHFRWAGAFTVIVITVIAGYYFVILGWVGSFFVSTVSHDTMTFDGLTSSYYPILSFGVVLGLVAAIAAGGVSCSIERLNKYGVLALIAILVPLAIYAVSLPDSDKGIAYYLTPDYTKISDPAIWSTAFGQVFFSLSLGMGVMVAYGSYIKNKISLAKASSVIIMTNASVSVIAGFMIFSFVFSYGADPASGTNLAFVVLPQAFSEMAFGSVVGSAFFALLFIAGLTSAVSLLEVPIGALSEQFGISRKKAVLASSGIVLLVGIVASLGYSPVSLSIGDTPTLDWLDQYIGSYGVVIAAGMFAVIVMWRMDKGTLLEQLGMHGKIAMPERILYVCKYVLPVIIMLSLVFSFVS